MVEVEVEVGAGAGVHGTRRGVRMATLALVKQGLVDSGIQVFIRLCRLCCMEEVVVAVVVVQMLHVGRPGRERLVSLRVLVVV